MQANIDGWITVAFSPDGERLAWHGFRTDVWVGGGEGYPARRIAVPSGAVSIAWDPSDDQLATLSWEAVEVWDADSARRKVSFPLRESMDVASWSPDGRYLAVQSAFSGRASVWDVETRDGRRASDAHPLRFSPRGDLVAVGSRICRLSDPDLSRCGL